LKEALSIGTGNAVAANSKIDGYFGNAAIKILKPEKIRKATDLLGKMGYQKEMDDFVLRMYEAFKPEVASSRKDPAARVSDLLRTDFGGK
jgi:hypothetical protein